MTHLSPHRVVTEESNTESSSMSTVHEEAPRNSFDRNRRALVVLIAIWLSFTITWIPWNLFNIYVDFAPNIDLEPNQLNLLFISCHLIAISSPTSNAILYGWLNTSVRVELVAGKNKLLAAFLKICANPSPVVDV